MDLVAEKAPATGKRINMLPIKQLNPDLAPVHFSSMRNPGYYFHYKLYALPSFYKVHPTTPEYLLMPDNANKIAA